MILIFNSGSILKCSPLIRIEQNLAGMVIRWSSVKIVCDRPALHPTWQSLLKTKWEKQRYFNTTEFVMNQHGDMIIKF